MLSLESRNLIFRICMYIKVNFDWYLHFFFQNSFHIMLIYFPKFLPCFFIVIFQKFLPNYVNLFSKKLLPYYVNLFSKIPSCFYSYFPKIPSVFLFHNFPKFLPYFNFIIFLISFHIFVHFYFQM